MHADMNGIRRTMLGLADQRRSVRDPATVGRYAVLRAEVEKPGLASAVCRPCCARHDLNDRVYAAYRGSGLTFGHVLSRRVRRPSSER